MLKILFTILSIGSLAKANPIGFARGAEFFATPIQGQVRVTCSGFNGSGSAVYTCRDVVLDPQAYDYFVGPQDPRADKVELIASHEDGSSRSKINNYDGMRGKSRDAFNLWISTLFQKPLLQYGVNSIRYRLLGGENLVESFVEGTFAVMVKKGVQRTCPQAQYTSTDANDCSSQYSICQRYFEEYRNCQ